MERNVLVPPKHLPGLLAAPENARGMIVFAHGSGSSRLSPRNQMAAAALNRAGFATLLFDLLTPAEERDRANVFDIHLLAGRLADAVDWIATQRDIADLPLGLFGASTGGAAAIVAAAKLGPRVGAVVSRGGRPDLAGAALSQTGAPTLLIVGGDDHPVVEMNEDAARRLRRGRLVIVPGATHLFPEPGALESVISLTVGFFEDQLAGAHRQEKPGAGGLRAGPVKG